MPEQDIHSVLTDDLSPFAQQVLRLDLSGAYNKLVARGPGNAGAKALLDGAAAEQMITSPVRDPDAAMGMLAGLWLWHDWLAESHRIAQSIQTPTGSFWHAIMHRREGDFANSKYWYARCAAHPVLPMLEQNAGALLNQLPADVRLLRMMNGGWHPEVFVDFVEEVHDRPDDPRYAIAVGLQQMEWRMLFDYCTREAAGK